MKRRIDELDGLRGVAALSVVFAHIFFAFPEAFASRPLLAPETWQDPLVLLKLPPLRAFFSGQAAVVLFFALSGFVLTLPYVSGRQESYWRYVARRFCRIYLPFAASIFLAALLFALRPEGGASGLSHWFHEESWTDPLTGFVILKHLLMTGVPEHMRLNNVMWSLVHELRISLVFPFIVMLLRKNPAGGLLGFLAVFLASQILVLGVPLPPVAVSLAHSAGYMLVFALGSVFAIERQRAEAWAASLKPATALLFAFLCVCVLALPPKLPGMDLPFALASCGILALSMGRLSARRLLTSAPCAWLGRVSFSLYLIHLPVLLFMFRLPHAQASTPLSVVLALAASLVAAHICYHLVERPSIALARNLPGARRAAVVRNPNL